MKRLPIIICIAFALTLICRPNSQADEIHLRKGKVQGVVVKKENGQVFVNTFNSKNVRMTRGVEQFPEKQVKKIVDTRSDTQRYLDDLAIHANLDSGADLETLLGLMNQALKLGSKSEAERIAFKILTMDQNQAEALKVIPPAEWQRRKMANHKTNPELQKRLEAWFEIKDEKKRKADHSAIKFEFGFSRSLVFMERVRRSKSSLKGRNDDISLTLNSSKDKGVYTLYVPNDYDPMKSWPLVLGLHGGGPDGKDRQDVVGSGRSAMNFYASGAARLGYIVVCPSAVNAPWNAKANDTFVQSVLTEVQLLYNVDLNRVYLTGHSMGGFGTWHFGPRYAKQWAVVAPMAGGGFRSLAPFEKTKTPIYLYHGADDKVVGPSNSRQAADQMKAAHHDFIYTEIPDSGHGFPADVREEMWQMFERRRLAVAPKRADKGNFRVALAEYSSFDQPVSKSEKLYFGAPGSLMPQDKKALLVRLKLGGGAAEHARKKLIELNDESVVPAVCKLLLNKKSALDVRREAARVLGGMRAAKSVKHLIKALRPLDADLVPALAKAIGEIAERSAKKALAKTLSNLDKDFDQRLSGSKMAYSDWNRMLGAYRAVSKALIILGDTTNHSAVAKSATKILLGDWEVRESDRAGLNKNAPLAPCAVAFVEALAATGDATTVDLLDKIGQKNSGLTGLADAIASAKTALN